MNCVGLPLPGSPLLFLQPTLEVVSSFSRHSLQCCVCPRIIASPLLSSWTCLCWHCVSDSSGCHLRVVRSLLRHGINDVGGRHCVGFNIVSGGGGESEERKTGYNKYHSPFSRHTGWASHLLGLPLCFPSPIPPSSRYVAAHIPLERGGAGAAVVRFAHLGALVAEPTSLNGGEGLVARWLQVVAGELWWQGGGKGGGGGGRMRAISTMIRLMSF